jgi:hypothetical protein
MTVTTTQQGNAGRSPSSTFTLVHAIRRISSVSDQIFVCIRL